ncbi:MAG: flavodoxin family protein [Pseudomonadota bacterium]
MTDVRKGQAPAKLERDAFHERFMQSFLDPAFGQDMQAVSRVEEIAWQAYAEGRKAPVTRKAGPGFADPDYELSVEWLQTRERLQAAQAVWANPAGASRVLLICGSARNDGSCPGEVSKTWRLTQIAREVIEKAGMQADVLDLSLLISTYKLHIHPCKACVSTAMPLCHWPCSCYPNHSLGQTGDWMAEIYERWVAAHGVIILTPVYWYQSPSGLKQMIDRLVCADGGNPDPTSTHGKKAEEAKALELAGWPYPKHLAGRAYGVVVHGDVAGIEGQRRSLTDWLDWMGLVKAGPQAALDRFIGYYEPYATSHDTLDKDEAVQQEAANVATAVTHQVLALRAGQKQADDGLRRPRPK